MSSSELVDRWWAWLAVVVTAAWGLGYAVATSAWDVVLVASILLVAAVGFTFESHRKEVNAAADATRRVWAQALARRGQRL